ncbi:MAG: hypothetical protein FWD28_01875 [Treponema sp.]|nr:hypothetical protein [Treponema sp.]
MFTQNRHSLLIIFLALACFSCINKEITAENKNEDLINMLSISNFELRKEPLINPINGYIKYRNRDTILMYKENTKESECFLIDHKYVYISQTEKSPGWHLIISQDYEAEGYIFLNDISQKSFYGDLEENENSGNYYQYLQNTEYKVIEQHSNINRRGPLLAINHNGKTANFWDTHNGDIDGIKYLLLDYYPDNNELLVLQQYWEGSSMFIYNLNFNEYRCRDIDFPYFNDSRTYMLSFVFIEDIGLFSQYSLKLFEVTNSYYNEILNLSVNIINNNSLMEITWNSNNNAYINFGEQGSIILEIGENVNIINNMLSL